MSHEDPGNISYSDVGGLAEQIRELREVVELPLINPELFRRVGITPPKGCLLFGPPGTGKTLLARAVASQLDCNFLKVVSSAIVDKYIGESARMIRTSADREIQRTLMELLNQLDGFDSLGNVKILKIHSNKITKHGEIDFEAVVKLSDGLSAADLRNVCAEAGMFAIRAEREFVID
ncbi:unnamed protein product [Caenorhabditis brenneri]